ncbi:phosphatidylserine synthase 2-like isoform X2 [Tigriopus californicus]|uniref:phosphatidylserine synthase 2-like isoform X2 n=1 Tax=Tigriopus californicus TaxID=6832 RepID=UPI0027D9DBD3|nr:phosphatidylserine synthase 2-like isoform X2 [Tigriopus californicus]
MDRARQTVDSALDLIKKGVEKEREKSNELCKMRTAHNWVDYRSVSVQDDETNSFFWRAHTVTILVFLVCCLFYVGLIEDPITDGDFNFKRGLLAALFFWVFLGMTIMPDGPFIRPHPALWRFAFTISIVYQLLLIVMLFQTPSDARKLVKHIDSSLGEPIPEKDYGGSCLIYDPSQPEDPYHNLKDKFDVFIFAHLFGYWCKTLIFRDWWLSTVISVMFEFLEYSLEHQLPNFSECWWDHWILDVLICNLGGTILGLFTLRYLKMKTYNWRGLWIIPTYRGKIKRIMAQFSPHSWIEFTWNPLSSLERWLAVIGIIVMFLITELNTFYLKYVFWLTPEHWLNFVRLFFMLLWGAVCLRETFQVLDDPECTKLGRQSFVLALIIFTEFLICVKFAWPTITKPIPQSIVIWWILGFVAVAIYTLIKFVLFKPTKLPEPEKEHIRVSPIHGTSRGTMFAYDPPHRNLDDQEEILEVLKQEQESKKLQ